MKAFSARGQAWAFSTLLALFLIHNVYDTRRDRALTEAREAAKIAQKGAQEAANRADRVLAYSDSVIASQRLLEAQARSHREAARTARLDAQRAKAAYRALAEVHRADSALAPALDAADNAITAANAEAQHWRDATEAEAARSAVLRTAVDSLSGALTDAETSLRVLNAASARLVRAARPVSFVKRLLPQAGIGVAAGIQPDGRPALVAGVTLGWRIK